MSYAGTYGRDETCPCGRYWRSCPRHSRTAPQVNRQIDSNKEHVREAEQREWPVKEVTVTYYDITCPGCDRTRRFDTQEEAEEWKTTHLKSPRAIAEQPYKEDDGWRPFASQD